MIYIPSVICTTLKLRSGVIPTFLDPNFKDYRVSVDTVSLLSGAVFWGCIYSSLLLGVLCAVGVFFLVWDVTRGIVLNITSMVIGKISRKYCIYERIHFSAIFEQIFVSLPVVAIFIRYYCHHHLKKCCVVAFSEIVLQGVL